MKIENIDKIQSNYYLIIPIISIGIWALYYLVRVGFFLDPTGSEGQGDFILFYNAGKKIIMDPEGLFDISGYFSMPNFACFYVLFALFPLSLALYMHYIFIYIFSIFFILEYNKILISMNLKEKSHRLLFLIVVTNGWFVYEQFFYNSIKFFIGFMLMYVLRREIQFQINHKEKDLKFYLIQYGFFVFILSIAPYLIFLLAIYTFQEIKLKNFFKVNIQKFLIMIIMFIAQNFLFIIYPMLLLEFLNGLYYPRIMGLKLIYLWDFSVPSELTMLISIIFTLVLIIITVILIFNRKLKIESKFGYFALSYIFFGVYGCLHLVLFAFMLLVFIPFVIQEEKFIDFIKKNKIFFIALISLFAIQLIPPSYTIYKYAPYLQKDPFEMIINFRRIFLLSIIVVCLIILIINNRNEEEHLLSKFKKYLK